MNLSKLPFSPRTVRARLTLWNVLVLTLVLVTLAGVLRTIAGRNLLAAVDEDLHRRSARHLDFWANISWASHETHNPATRGNGPQSSMVRRFGGLSPENVGPAGQWRTPVAERVFDLKGMQSYPTYQGEPPWDRAAFTRATVGRAGYTVVRTAGVPLRVYSVPLRRKSGVMAGVVQIASGLEPLERTMGNLDRGLLTVVPLGMLGAWFGGMFLTGRVLRPVRQITRATGRIGARDLSERLPVTGDDEFSELARTVNTMLARLESSFEQQRRFTADASHELRTPLTVVKSVASRFLSRRDLPEDYRRGLERLDSAAGVMEGVVQDLLLLARSDSGQLHLNVSPQSLSTVLKAALACVLPEGGPTVRNEVPEDGTIILGDASHLARLFSNLLNNAIRHTPPEGSIILSARESGDRVFVTVADTGTGISAEHLPHVTERFYRVDTARSRAEGGTGLGLAICKSIAEAHGGQIRVESDQEKGTTVTVSLPTGDRGPVVAAESQVACDSKGIPAEIERIRADSSADPSAILPM